MKPKENFFKLHYDWLVAIAGVAALAAAVALLMPVISTSPDAAAERRRSQLNAITPANEKVAPIAIDVLHGAQRLAKAPPALTTIEPASASFLASERRVFCKPGDASVKSCGRPIPADSKECPFCSAGQEVVKKSSADFDNDGLPNDWETKYGLNPNDASDADKDPDGDGFTNAEEYAAKTDPTDKNSHPDYSKYLSVEGGLKQVFLPFWFNAASPIPGGYRYTFQNLKARKTYEAKTFSVKVDEEIANESTKTGWFAGKYTKLSKEEKIAGSQTNAKKVIDVSTVEVYRKDDGRRLVLRIGDRQIAVASEATLAWDRFGGKKFTVKEGDEIDLNGSKYRIISLKAKGAKGCTVVLEALSNKKQITLEST